MMASYPHWQIGCITHSLLSDQLTQTLKMDSGPYKLVSFEFSFYKHPNSHLPVKINEDGTICELDDGGFLLDYLCIGDRILKVSGDDKRTYTVDQIFKNASSRRWLFITGGIKTFHMQRKVFLKLIQPLEFKRKK